MKKVFFFAAVLICSVSLMAEQTLVKFNMTEAVKVSEKVYDGTTAAQTTGGAFQIIGNVSEGDDVFVKLESAYFDNANVGGGHKVYLEFSLAGQDADKYALKSGWEKDSVLNGVINAKKLVVDTVGMRIAIEKIFVEGDASAQVFTPAKLEEGAVIGDDDVTMVTTARYKDAAPETGKTITACFALVGADRANYKLDTTSYVYSNEGVISRPVTPATFPDGAYFHTSDTTGLCQGDLDYASYNLAAGEVTNFSIFYGRLAQEAGFEDVENAVPSADGVINIVVPSDAPCGTYQAEVVLTYNGQDGTTHSTDRLPFKFTVHVSAADIVKMYEDVVGVRDMDNRYVAYQWLRDGQAIPGATKAYYQEEGGLKGIYTIQITTEDGEVYTSCETHFGPATNVATDKSFDDTSKIVVITARSGVRYNVLGEIVK